MLLKHYEEELELSEVLFHLYNRLNEDLLIYMYNKSCRESLKQATPSKREKNMSQ